MQRIGRRLAVGAFSALLSIQLIAPVFVYAAGNFPHGDGSAERPYRIANCEQLYQVNDDMAAHYKLVSDIDCTGVDFGHLAENNVFEGSFSGNGHTIKNLTLDDRGLFETIDAGGEVKDLFLEGGSVTSSSDAVGSIAGRMNIGTITNVHSTMSVTSVDSNAGGLVGLMGGGGGTIGKSTYSGTLTGYRNVGGLVGNMAGDAYIFDSYTDATINSIDSEDARYFGGIAGRVQVPPSYIFISRVYSTSEINLLPDAQGVGGLIGYTEGAAIGTSFAAATITGGSSNIGEVYGVFSDGTTSNIVSYEPINGLDCAGIGAAGDTPGECDEALTDLEPDYYKGNSSNPPFNFADTQYWDFNTTWMVVEDDYPALKNESPTVKAAVDGDDANGDSLPDRFQPNILPIMVQGEHFTTVELDTESSCVVDDDYRMAGWIAPEYVLEDPEYDYPSLMTLFQVLCPEEVGSVEVTIILDQLLDPSGLVLRYFNDQVPAYSTIEGAVFGTRIVNGQEVTTVTYSLVDDGPNDLDTENAGVIFDPVGVGVFNPAENPEQSPESGSGSDDPAELAETGQNIVFQVALGLTVIVVAALALRKSNRVQ